MAVATFERVKIPQFRGLALPIVRVRGGYWASKELEDLVWSSMVMIIGTPQGSRIMLPGFGSRFSELLFEQNDETLKSLAEVYIIRAIERWEPRARIVNVIVVVTDDALEVAVTFHVSSDPEAITRGLRVKRNESFALLSQV